MDRGQNRAAEEGAAPLRVAQIVGKLMAGGVENVVYNYYRRMDKAKVQFDFLVDADSQENLPDDLLEMGAGLHRIPPYQDLRHYMPALYDLFLAQNYPIVHAHLNTLNAFPLAAAKAAKVPVRICHNHSTACPGEGFRTHLKYALRPLAYRSATHCFACGAHAAVWMYGNDRFQDGKVALMHNAIDLDRFAFDAIQRQKMRERLGLGKNLVLGHAGRFMYQKNHAFLLEVFAALHERQPNSVLLLVGDGELRAEMGIRAVEMGLSGAVRFVGSVQDVAPFYQAMDVFCLPSRYEGLGMVAVEAQAAGLPALLSTAVPREARVTDSCIFLPLDDGPEVWAHAILASAAEGRQSVSLDRFVAAGFDIHREAERLENTYLRSAGRSAPEKTFGSDQPLFAGESTG